MSAPNRSAEVQALFDQGIVKKVIDSTPELGDERRKQCIRIAQELNKLDDGNWGLLKKTDRTPPYIPTDVIVWRPTMEHFDVIVGETGGPGWKPWGVVPDPAWVWEAVPPLHEDDPPPPDDDLKALLKEALREVLAEMFPRKISGTISGLRFVGSGRIDGEIQ